MKAIYMVLVGFIAVLVSTQYLYHRDFNSLQKLLSIGKGIGKRPLFTKQYRPKIKQQLMQLSYNTKKSYTIEDTTWNEDAKCIAHISSLTDAFAILNENQFAYGDSALQLNLKLCSKRPIVLHFKLVKLGQYYMIDDIVHLNELVEYVNLYNALPEKEKRCQ